MSAALTCWERALQDRFANGSRASTAVPPSDGNGSGPGPPESDEVAEQPAAAILEQVRAQGHYEATRLRQQAAAEAEAAKAAILEQARAAAAEEAARLREQVIAEAEAAKAAILQQAREQAYYEASLLREQATAQTEEASVALDIAREEAAREAAQLRQEALAEAERVKTAIVEQGRAQAREEVVRLRDRAIAEADQVKAAILDRAAGAAARREAALAEAERLRAEAEALRSEAERAREAAEEARQAALSEKPVAVARDQGRDGATVTLLRASEVGGREFPEVRRGYDRESVRKWLSLVELSYGALEEELDRARGEWDRAIEVLSVTRLLLSRFGTTDEHSLEGPFQKEFDRARAEWARSLETLGTARQSGSERDFRSVLVGTAQLEAKLGRRLFGYSTSQVGRLLDSLLSQLARLEHEIAVLRTENDEMRARLLRQVSHPGEVISIVDEGDGAGARAVGAGPVPMAESSQPQVLIGPAPASGDTPS